jgi:hypothetical protein
MTTTRTATLTRPVIMSTGNGSTRTIRTFPVGTTVYVTERRGEFTARVCGSLFTQDVPLSAVEPC